MSVLSTLAGQLLDKLADAVVSPCVGYVTATSSSGTVIIPQGQIGTLPDGREIRVRRTSKATTAGNPVPVRLLGLAPTFPKAANFATVAPGAVVTWLSPSIGLVATAPVTSAGFSAGTFAAVTAVVENDYAPEDARAFAASAFGRSFFILHPPEVNNRQRMGGEHSFRRQFHECLYRLELRATTTGTNADRRTLVANAYGAAVQCLQGATVGSEPVELRQWRQLSKDPSESRWELRFVVVAITNGRAQSFGLLGEDPRTGIAAPKMTDVQITQTVNAGSQPSPYTVTTDIPTP